jgi:hypothetical protein
MHICQALKIGLSTVELSLSEDVFTLKYDSQILYQTRNRISIEYFHDGDPFGALLLQEQCGHVEHIDPITGQVDYREPKFKQFHIPIPGSTSIPSREAY